MSTNTMKPEDRRPRDPLMRAADAALRRAALKAQERTRLLKQASDSAGTPRGSTAALVTQ